MMSATGIGNTIPYMACQRAVGGGETPVMSINLPLVNNFQGVHTDPGHTVSRASQQLCRDYYGIYKRLDNNQPSFQGARFVQNRVNNPEFWTDGTGTTTTPTGDITHDGTVVRVQYNGTGASAAKRTERLLGFANDDRSLLVYSVRARLTSAGSGDKARLTIIAGQPANNGIVLTGKLTTEWQTFSTNTKINNKATTPLTLQFEVHGDVGNNEAFDIELSQLMVECAREDDTNAPSEWQSSLDAPTWYPYKNGNSVDGNGVVTYAQGEALHPSRIVDGAIRYDTYVPWRTLTAKSVGDRVVPTGIAGTAGGNGFYYECIASTGGTGGTEPNWPTVIGNTVVDQEVTWECKGVYTLGGLQCEPATINYIKANANFLATGWVSSLSSLVHSSGHDILGARNEFTTIDTNGFAQGALAQTFPIVNNSNDFIFSCFIRKRGASPTTGFPEFYFEMLNGTAQRLRVQMDAFTGQGAQTFMSGTWAWKIEDMGTDFWRFEARIQNNNTGNNTARFTFTPAKSQTLGGPSSSSATNTENICYPQCEEGPGMKVATSPIETPSSPIGTATRAHTTYIVNFPDSWNNGAAGGSMFMDVMLAENWNDANTDQMRIVNTNLTNAPLFVKTAAGDDIAHKNSSNDTNAGNGSLLNEGARRTGTAWGTFPTPGAYVSVNGLRGTQGSFGGTIAGTNYQLGYRVTADFLHGWIRNFRVFETQDELTDLDARTAYDDG